MSFQEIKSDSFVELSFEEQQLLSGGGFSQRSPETSTQEGTSETSTQSSSGGLPPGYDKYVYHHVDVFRQSPRRHCGRGGFGS